MQARFDDACLERIHYGILTTDIKQVEWYAAQYRAWGVAVYFENLRAYDEHPNTRRVLLSSVMASSLDGSTTPPTRT